MGVTPPTPQVQSHKVFLLLFVHKKKGLRLHFSIPALASSAPKAAGMLPGGRRAGGAASRRGQGQGVGLQGYAWTFSSPFGLAAWFCGVAGFVTLTEITSPLAEVTVVVTVPSGAVVTAVVLAGLVVEEADEALPAELKRLSADAALLLTALMVIDGLPKSVGSKNTVWLTSDCFAAGHRGATQARLR
jgi:hypothetical protein